MGPRTPKKINDVYNVSLYSTHDVKMSKEKIFSNEKEKPESLEIPLEFPKEISRLEFPKYEGEYILPESDEQVAPRSPMEHSQVFSLVTYEQHQLHKHTGEEITDVLPSIAAPDYPVERKNIDKPFNKPQ